MRADEGVADDVPGVVVQPDVVERELERVDGAFEEGGQLARNVERGLAAVRQCVECDQRYSAGGMFRFRRKTFSGSYFAFNSVSRS